MLTWEAYYNNGSYLSQYNENGSENKYGDINRNILEKFILVDSSGNVKFVLNLDPEKKLIFRRRTAKSLVSKTIREVVYIIGWQQNVKDVAVQSINFYFESTGYVENTDGFKKDHHWFYPVIFLPEEKI